MVRIKSEKEQMKSGYVAVEWYMIYVSAMLLCFLFVTV